MKKKLIILTSVMLLCASCGKTEEQAADTTPAPTLAATLAPAATQSPQSAQKAQEKVNSEGSNANATVVDGDQTKSVNLSFTLSNDTGIDFPDMRLSPVTAQSLTETPNILPEGYTFKTGESINLDPSGADNLTTTLFNIVAIDSNGTGYVFQNIDLSANSNVQLIIESGVPKAIIK